MPKQPSDKRPTQNSPPSKRLRRTTAASVVQVGSEVATSFPVAGVAADPRTPPHLLPRGTAAQISQNSAPAGRKITRCVDPAATSFIASGTRDPDHSIVQTGNAGPKYFRIANLPSDWNKDCLLTALETIDPCLKGQNVQLSIYPGCFNTKCRTALLNLSTCSAYFQFLKPNEFNYAQMPDETHLVIDSHIDGFTPLNTPEGEIIAELLTPSLPEFLRC